MIQWFSYSGFWPWICNIQSFQPLQGGLCNVFWGQAERMLCAVCEYSKWQKCWPNVYWAWILFTLLSVLSHLWHVYSLVYCHLYLYIYLFCSIALVVVATFQTLIAAISPIRVQITVQQMDMVHLKSSYKHLWTHVFSILKIMCHLKSLEACQLIPLFSPQESVYFK